MQPYFW